MKINHIYFIVFSVFIILISACEADISTSSSSGGSTLSSATAPLEVSNVTGNPTDRSIILKWQAPTLTSSHKKADGTQLTKADVSHKVFIVEKGSQSRTVENIIALDKSPIEVKKGIVTVNINDRKPNTTYEIVVQAVNSTDTTKVSKGMRVEVTTLTTDHATAPPEASDVTGSPIDTSARITWQAPNLTDSHKKADGTALTTADVSYKVYRVAKGSDERTVAEIKTADKTPLEVAKGTTSINITNLNKNTAYEVVVQSVNSTDTTKVSTGVRIEVTTLAQNHATAPADASSVAGSPDNDSVAVSWQAPNLTDSHKKADGTQLTTADVSYKVYRVAKGSDERTVAEIKTADTTPIEVAKGTTSTTINNLIGSTTYEIVVQAVNSTDSTKASTGIRIEVATTNPATAPADARSVAGSPADTSARITWQAPALTGSHKKANGQRLTEADVSYKVYRVVKGNGVRTVAAIKTADNNPLAVAKGTTSTNITSLTPATTYEIVVQAVNSTDTTKVSTGKRIEVTTLANNHATAPADASSVVGSPADDSVGVSWQAPAFTSSHKKADGTQLTKADVYYKVYRVVKGAKSRTIAEIKEADKTPMEVAKGTTSTTITNLTGSTTYEIVVQAVNSTDSTKASTGIRIEVATTNPATAPADARSVTAGSTTASSTTLSWTDPTLTTSHKKANGQRLTTADVSYKVYRVAKGRNARTIAEIKTADGTPLAVAKGTKSTTITNLTGSTTYEIVVQAINSTDTTKVSTGVRIEVTTTNPATAPADASSVAGNPTDDSVAVSWTAPALTSSHKKADGTKLTKADVSYKVYRVAKNGANTRSIAQIITADKTPLEVVKGTTSATITNLTPSTTYEIVVQAINSTDTTKTSTGVRIEVTTDNLATAPAEASSVTGSPTDTSARITWQAPTLTTSHKKADGQRLTTADVSYKVYRVAKGSDARTIAEIKTADKNPLAVARGTTSTTITSLTPNTTYEIVVQAVNFTDTTKVSTGKRIEVTTVAQNHATAPADASNVRGIPDDDSIAVSWQAPTLTDSHKKPDGTQLTQADVYYKVYRAVKGAKSRTIAEIKTADKTPIAVAKGITSTTITNLTGSTTYEVVVQAVNFIDTTKASTGIRIEVVTTNPATAPADASNVRGSSTDTSARITWQAPALDTSHKKANGQSLTTADVSYKVYRVAKGKNARTIAAIKTADKNPIAVAKGKTNTSITNLTPITTYEIVVQAVNTTDITKASTGVRIEVTTKNSATAPSEASSITGSLNDDGSVTVSWTAPTLTSSHKKANGQALTKADVSYKVYRVERGGRFRTVAAIKAADPNPLAVGKGTTSINITNLKSNATYEVVVQAINSTDTTKVSTGVKEFVFVTNRATAPPDISSVVTGKTDNSITLNWSILPRDSHQKRNGQRLTASDISYKVYRVVKGAKSRTIAAIKAADRTPLAVAKGTTSINITNLNENTTYEIVVQAVNSTDTTKVSTGEKVELTTTNNATAPPDARSVTGSPIDDSITVSWTAPDLTSSHKKTDGQALTAADVLYKVYHIAKGKDARTIAEIKAADKNPLAVAKGTTSTTITNLTGSTTYEIVVQAVNSTAIAKVSTGVRIEVTTTNLATAPADVRDVTAESLIDTSATISWKDPVLTNSHKKSDGQTLTTADVSYKVYRVVKGGSARTIAAIKAADNNPLAVAKGITNTNITNLTHNTTYEVVVQAVNSTAIAKVSTGVRVEVTTTNNATAPPDARSVTVVRSTDDSVEISWQAPNLTASHKKTNGQRLTEADVSYKVYRVTKGKNARSIAAIKTADNNPIAVAKGTTSTTITNLTFSTTYEIVVQAVNATYTTKVSTGIKTEVTTVSYATEPADARNVTAASITNKAVKVSWQVPDITDSHKKPDGTQLTQADVSYKVYHVAKKGTKKRTVAEIIAADTSPIEEAAVAKGTTSTNVDITNLTFNTTYEIVVQAINTTDTTKVSTGVRVEVIANPATAPPEVNNIVKDPTDINIELEWTAPTLTSSHKKTDGQALTKADLSYKIYALEKGARSRSIAAIKATGFIHELLKGLTVANISLLLSADKDVPLKPNTTYEIVIQAVNSTDPTKVSTGKRIEVTTLSSLNLVMKRGNTIVTNLHIKVDSVGVNIRSVVTPSVSGIFFITPDLTQNTGILFNTNTGVLSGKAKKLASKKTYTIVFTASDGRLARTSFSVSTFR